MRNLLKLEFRKLQRQKSFYVCTGVMVALVILGAVISNALLKIVPEDLTNQFQLSGIQALLSASADSSFNLIICIFISLFVCDDYSQQTIKTIHARGYARTTVYFSKLISVLTAATIMYVVVLLVSFLFGTAFFGIGEPGNFKFIALIGAQYVILMACTCLYFVIASLLRNKGAAISVCIVGPIVLNILLALWDAAITTGSFSSVDYWVENLLTDMSSLTVSQDRILACLATAIIYMGVSLTMGMLHAQRKDP